MNLTDPIKLIGAVLLTAIAFLIYTPVRATSHPAKVAALTVVQMMDAEGEGYCSAVVVQPGIALTAKHCQVGGPGWLEQNGQLLPVAEWKLDTARDLALLTVPGLQCPCAQLAPKAAVESGAPIVILGYPNGGPLAATYGWIVGRIQVGARLGIQAGEYVFVSGHAIGGNSGGGLFLVLDGAPRLFGITSAADKNNTSVLAVEVAE